MAQSSIGFRGSVNEIEWAKVAPLLGNGPCVDLPGSLGVSQVAGFRRVLVAAGGAFDSGVLTTLSAAESPAADMAAPTAGQWHLLVLRRVWATKATSLLTIPHSVTTNALPSAAPTSLPAAMLTSPGVQSDQALAWLWVNVTTTAVGLWPVALLPNTARASQLALAGLTPRLFLGLYPATGSISNLTKLGTDVSVPAVSVASRLVVRVDGVIGFSGTAGADFGTNITSTGGGIVADQQGNMGARVDTAATRTNHSHTVIIDAGPGVATTISATFSSVANGHFQGMMTVHRYLAGEY